MLCQLSWLCSLPTSDMDDMHGVLVPVHVVYSVCVSGSASCALEDLEVCTSLCPWRFMVGTNFLQVLGRHARMLNSGGRAGLLVSFPKGMVSCKPGQALVLEARIFCWAMWLLQCGFSCMGCRVPPWRRTVPAVDEADVRCVHVSGRQACSGCVAGSAAHALEGRNLGVCSSLCPWWFL